MRALLIAAAALVATAVAPAAAEAITWSADPAPFRLTFTDGDAVVARQAPDGRMSYLAGGATHHLTDLITSAPVAGGTAYTVATDEPGRTATVTVTSTPQGARVHWALSDPADVTTMFEAFTAAPDEHYVGGSSAAKVDLRGTVRAWRPGKEGRHADNYCSDQAEVSTPFYLSSGGYGFYAETSAVGRFAFPGAVDGGDGPECALTPTVPTGAPKPVRCPVAATAQPDRVQVCAQTGELTYDVFAGSPAQVTSDYYGIAGRPSLPPPSEFGLLKWRDVNADQAQVVDDVRQMQAAGIPLTTIFVDNPWEAQPGSNTTRQNGSACTNTGAFDPRFFPDPQAMIDDVHALGVRFGLWVGPQVVTTATGGGSCASLNGEWAANHWIIPGTNYIDFSNPAARQHYIDKLTAIFRMGVDMAKEDRGEEYQLDTSTLAGGPGSELYNRYPVLYQSAVSEALRAVDGDDFETLVRTAVTGTAQSTHGMWGSDANEAFSGLRAQVRFGTSESLAGHFAWGSDVGGIDPVAPANATNSPTPSLFTRWAQFGALSPVMEVGGAGLNATPWLYPPATVDRFRAAAVLHYELFPYLYGLARHAAATGVPILRTVGYEYPHDQQAWALDQEFMVGPSLLAAPVTADRAEADGAAGQPTPVSVYLPAGRWIDLYSGAVLDGGRTLVRDTPLDEIPLYIKAGAAIGFNLRTPDVWEAGWDTDALSQPGRAGWMVAPGSGPAAAIGADGGRLVARGGALRLSGAPAQAQVLVLAARAPRAVRVDGRRLPRLDAGALRGAREGWTFTGPPFGGVLVKLAPRHGSARLIVR
jgi:alpha-D-xyloside xylohydrolase